MNPVTRRATVADAAAIVRIYNQGIEERIATFETEPRTEAQIRDLIETRGEYFPTVVVELDAHVVAYGSAGSYRARECYAGIAEHSVYVDREHRGKGLGSIALEALCAEYKSIGFWKVLSRIFPENHASLKLHERCGFRIVGVYERHAQLDGVWKDCVIVERLLQ